MAHRIVPRPGSRLAHENSARRAAAKAGPRAELREYPVDHLDVYDGPERDKVLADQIDFAQRVVGRTNLATGRHAV